jgi:hypothetical protein
MHTEGLSKALINFYLVRLFFSKKTTVTVILAVDPQSFEFVVMGREIFSYGERDL